MTKSDRNYKIVEHLRERFLQRHRIDLTRNRRMMLLRQISTGIAKLLFTTKNGKKLYRVKLYSNETFGNISYTVMYCPKLDQILTVLPHPDSAESALFLKKNGLTKKQVDVREFTAKERTDISVREAIQRETDQRVTEGKKRLKRYHEKKERKKQKRLDAEMGL